jgi:hypothetical protein
MLIFKWDVFWGEARGDFPPLSVLRPSALRLRLEEERDGVRALRKSERT